MIYEYDNVIFKPHTAEITGESSGIYRGQQYTLYFEWSAEDRFQISGFEPVEGVTFIEPNYYGVS